MRHLPIALITALAAIAGCSHVAAVGGADSGSDADSDTDADTDAYGFTGEVSLIHTAYGADASPGDDLSLEAKFSNEDVGYGGPGWVGTFETPAGASCEIFVVSPLDDPPDPLPQIDAGEIRAGLHGGGDYLSVTFEDGAYTVDMRSEGDPEHPIPDWAAPEQEFFVDGLGSSLVPDFSQLAQFPLPGYFTIPAPGAWNLYPDDFGTYTIAWDQFGDDTTAVVASFNMDWASAEFVCRPVGGAWSLDLPYAWIQEYTWGGGARLELRIINRHEISLGGGFVETEVVRAFSQYVFFNEYGED